jgi:arsenate reductase-like glutaredoxin family protein
LNIDGKHKKRKVVFRKFNPDHLPSMDTFYNFIVSYPLGKLWQTGEVCQRGQWRLALPFDVCHSFRPGSAWVSQHSLSINSKRTDITRDDLQQVAKKMNIKKTDAIIDQVHAAVSKWTYFATQTNVNKDLTEAIAKTLWLAKKENI